MAVNGVLKRYFARLNSDGRPDLDFPREPLVDGMVTSFVAQKDGDVVFASYDYWAGGIQLRRLRPDGLRDETFKVDPLGRPFSNGHAVGPRCLAVQRDGSLLVAGWLGGVDGFGGNLSLIRLRTNGLRDGDFISPKFLWDNGPGSGLINGIVEQPDGKILVIGQFAKINEQDRRTLARLNQDGSLDLQFNVTVNGPVEAIALQGDGRILIGGSFWTVNGVGREHLARLHADGKLDDSFDASWPPQNDIYSILLEDSGKILIGGRFAGVGDVLRVRMARLHPNGSLDMSFDPGSGLNGPLVKAVGALALQRDGRILVGGFFNGYNGVSRSGIARIYGDPLDSALHLLNPGHKAGQFRVSVPTEVGKRYTLEFKDKLEDKPWNSLISVSGDGSVQEILDRTANEKQRFYRVRVE